MARRLSSEIPGQRLLMIFLVYCIISLFYYVSSVVSWHYVIYFHTHLAQYSLFVLKVLLNKQTNNYAATALIAGCAV